jgi:hypothetical protein
MTCINPPMVYAKRFTGFIPHCTNNWCQNNHWLHSGGIIDFIICEQTLMAEKLLRWCIN